VIEESSKFYKIRSSRQKMYILIKDKVYTLSLRALINIKRGLSRVKVGGLIKAPLVRLLSVF
jgi:hypothetical protein